MSNHFPINPETILAVFYDIETDEHVLVRADGSQERRIHAPDMDELALQYIVWASRVNGGPYVRAYGAAVAKFARMKPPEWWIPPIGVRGSLGA